MQPILEVKNLVKSYGKVRAVDGINFTVTEGICFGLLGPNGAGKTTAIEIMESIHQPDAGEVYYKGEKIRHFFKEKIGIQFQSTALQEFLTVKETLVLFSRLYPKHRPLEEIIRICDLEEFVNRDNRKLSGGQRQRMLLGIALINDPDLLFLDEPTTGLDPHARRNFWRLIENIKKEKKTVILTTHYMDEAEYLCEEIIIMDKGKILEQGNPQELLKKHFGSATLKIPAQSLNESAKKALAFHCPLEAENGFIVLQCGDVDQTVKELIRHNVSLSGLSVERQTLDDLFIKLTGASLDAASAESSSRNNLK
jgi:ABC-2 type transport system ATP-binding protein